MKGILTKEDSLYQGVHRPVVTCPLTTIRRPGAFSLNLYQGQIVAYNMHISIIGSRLTEVHTKIELLQPEIYQEQIKNPCNRCISNKNVVCFKGLWTSGKTGLNCACRWPFNHAKDTEKWSTAYFVMTILHVRYSYFSLTDECSRLVWGYPRSSNCLGHILVQSVKYVFPSAW